jgi:hypothetical protein
VTSSFATTSAGPLRSVARPRDYASTPLVKKLGIKERMRVSLVRPPRGFELPPLPAGATLSARAKQGAHVIVLFSTSRADLEQRFGALATKLDPAGGLWVAWPKKVSPIGGDLTFEVVQRVGLDAGLVDNKSCSIDQDWQALRFVYRVKDRPTGAR